MNSIVKCVLSAAILQTCLGCTRQSEKHSEQSSMPVPTHDEYSFGMYTSRRGDTFREGKNPFTGEVVRFYEGSATLDECRALEAVLGQYDIALKEDCLDYCGEIDGTRICIPDTDLKDAHFRGTSIELTGATVSDAALTMVLEMGKSANLFFENFRGERTLAAPTPEIRERVKNYRDEEVVIVDTVAKFRAWLDDHVGSRKVY